MGMQSKPEQNVKTRWFAFQRVGIRSRPLYIKECANESSYHFLCVLDARNVIHKTSIVVSSSHNAGAAVLRIPAKWVAISI